MDNLNEEEKKAIEILNNLVKNNGGMSFQDNEDGIFKCYDSKSIKVLLDILRNKDKEILELKERIADLESQLFEAEEFLQGNW